MTTSYRYGTTACGVAIATVALVTGCTSSTPGAPQAADNVTASDSPSSTTNKDPTIWDPCTGIPAAALTGVGLNPVPPKLGQTGPIHGWKTCSWMGDWFDVIVYSTHHTMDDFKQAGKLPNAVPFEVNGHQGVMSHIVENGKTVECATNFAAKEGAVSVEVNDNSGGETTNNFCGKAKEVTDAFAPYLPK